MRRGLLVALGATLVLALAPMAGASTIYTWATAVPTGGRGLDQGMGVDAARNCTDAVLGAPNAAAPAGCERFLSLGLDGPDEDAFGGWIVLDFGTMFDHAAVVFETTNNCTVSDTTDGCVAYGESADVYVSTTLDLPFSPSTWERVGTVYNDAGQAGAKVDLLVGGPFRYLALVDTTKQYFAGGPSTDGFDVNAVRVTAVPEPASLTLLGLGLAGIARAARRKK